MRYLIIILTLFITLNNNIFSAVLTSTQAGAWNNINTWGGVGIPGINDDVIVNHVVSLGANFSITNVTINSGGRLYSTSLNNNLTVSGDLSIAAGGEFRGVDLVTNNLNLVFSGNTNYSNAGTASFKNITVNATRTLTLNSSIGRGLLNTSTININGTLNCQGNTLEIDLLSVFKLNVGGTLRLNNAGGVNSTITGLGTINYNVGANYYFDANVTNTGFGSISNVNNMTFDGCVIGTTSSLTISGGLFNGAVAGYIEDLNTSNTFTFTGNIAGNNTRLGIGSLKIENN